MYNDTGSSTRNNQWHPKHNSDHKGIEFFKTKLEYKTFKMISFLGLGQIAP